MRAWLVALAAGGTLLAWSPRLHEVQTAKAVRLVPRRMAALLRAHPQALLEGARGIANDQPPSPEQVEAQFRTILRLTEERHRPEDIVRDLGVLAHLTQLLCDPSATTGVSPLRESFENYAEANQGHLLVTREPYWALRGSLDPAQPLKRLGALKLARNGVLKAHFDEEGGRRLGPWDELSIPFAQLQLAFSTGVNATANLYILLWRAAGDQWELPASP